MMRVVMLHLALTVVMRVVMLHLALTVVMRVVMLHLALIAVMIVVMLHLALTVVMIVMMLHLALFMMTMLVAHLMFITREVIEQLIAMVMDQLVMDPQNSVSLGLSTVKRVRVQPLGFILVYPMKKIAAAAGSIAVVVLADPKHREGWVY